MGCARTSEVSTFDFSSAAGSSGGTACYAPFFLGCCFINRCVCFLCARTLKEQFEWPSLFPDSLFFFLKKKRRPVRWVGSGRWRAVRRRKQPKTKRNVHESEFCVFSKAAYGKATHQSELPTSGASMLNRGHGVVVNTTEKTPRNKRYAGPLSYKEDPSVVHARVRAGEIGKHNSRVFGIMGPKGNRRSLNFKNVICHDTLGDASLRRVNALDGILRRPKHMAAVITMQSQLHNVRGRKALGDRMISPWASTSVDLEMKTVRLAPKLAGRAVPCRQAWQAADRNLARRPQSGTRCKANHQVQGRIHVWRQEVLQIRQTQCSTSRQEVKVVQEPA